jgi:hypothetical protein
MVAQHSNGDWPDFAATIDLPPPKPRYSYEELAGNYATVTLQWGALWPRVIHALEYLRGHLIGAKADAGAARDGVAALQREMKLLREAVQGQAAAKELGLGPVQSASQIDSQVAAVTKRISGELHKVVSESPGPKIEAEPDRIIRIVEKVLEEDAAKKLAIANAARLSAIDDAQKVEAERKKKLRQKMIAMFLGAIAAGAGSWIWGKAQGRIEAHDAAVAEVRQEMKAAGVVAAPAAAAPGH